jgi:molybdate transport system substrate-binding protein
MFMSLIFRGAMQRLKNLLIASLLAMATSAAASDNAVAPVKVFSAGSLTGALTAVIKLYKEKTGVEVQAEFGPAGLMRERIENGERPDLFASANMEHPEALAEKGLATVPVVMARNRICAKALPAFGLTTANLFDRMLDPKTVGIGTSTPKVDPGGDYAWMVFARAEQARPGAQKILESKARQLAGGKHNPPVPAGRDASLYFFEEHQIDISLGYCSSRQTTPDLRLTTVELPPELRVNADYGLSVLGHSEAALRFALFVLSPQAQQLIGQYGFTPVTEKISSPTAATTSSSRGDLQCAPQRSGPSASNAMRARTNARQLCRSPA